MSKNAVTLEQLEIACRNVIELRAAGMTENLAIRNLEQFANIYAKLHHLGHASPDHANQYDQWSLKALEAEAANPGRRHGEYLRVEHGTPRRQFARLVLAGFEKGVLSEDWLNDLCDRRWRVAVITHEEDRLLNRSSVADDPEERWKSAGIEFGRNTRTKALNRPRRTDQKV